MQIRPLFLRAAALAIFAFSTAAMADPGESRIAVIPVLENSPPALHIAQVAAGHVEDLIRAFDRLEVVDSQQVTATARKPGVSSWPEIADALSLDLAILLSVSNAHVEYLGEQYDHVSVGEFDTEPGTVHVYEGEARIRLTVRDLNREIILFDEEKKGSASESYRQSHDAAKYARIVSAVRELASIFNEEIDSGNPNAGADDHSALATEAAVKAVKKFKRPLRKALGS